MSKKVSLISIMVFGFFCILAVSRAAYGITINLADRNVGVNDNKDDSSIVQQAFDDVQAAGGGTIVFPDGITDINKQVAMIPSAINPANLTLKGDGGAVIRVAVGSDTTAFYFGNLYHLDIDNLTFVGKNVPEGNAQFIDARIVIYAGFVNLTRITRTSFFGLAVPSGGSIVHASTGLTMESCQFGGVNAGFPDGAAVTVDCCSSVNQNTVIRGSVFLDYAYLKNEYLSKTPAFTGSWVKAKQIYYTGSTAAQRLSIEDTFFDEGAAVAIDAQNIGALTVRGIKVNVSASSPGTGIRADNVKRIRVEDSQFGYTPVRRPFAVITNSTAEMIGIQLDQGVGCPRVQADATIIWRQSDCN